MSKHQWHCTQNDGSKLTVTHNERGVFVETSDGGLGATVQLDAERLSHLGAHLMALADDLGREPSIPRGAKHLATVEG